MKQKNSSSLYFLLAGIFLFFGCQTDEKPAESHSTHGIASKKISLEEFASKSGAAEKLHGILQKRVGRNSARMLGDQLHDFSVDTTQIHMIQKGDYDSYTFPVQRADSPDLVENLVLSRKKDGSYSATLVKYDLSERDRELLESHGLKDIKMKAIGLDIENVGTGSLSARGTKYCRTLTYIICNYEYEHVAGKKCGSIIGTRSYTYCYSTEEEYMNMSFQDPGVPVEDGGGGPSSDPTPEPEPEPEEPVVTLPILENPKTECNKVKKLAGDVLFRQKMNNLLQATEYKFEKVFTAYQNPTPASVPTSQFKFLEVNGTISKPQAEYGYFPSILGIMHSHYEGLLSIYSVDDLTDIYIKMKNPEIADNFFSGLVTKSGTKYVMTISDRAKFVAFGDKYLATEDSRQRFVDRYYIKKYNIQETNSASINEKNFLKMMTDLQIGIAMFSGNSDFTVWQKLDYVNNQVLPSNCN